jgi:O-antigen/teichoic acid export membrane protein
MLARKSFLIVITQFVILFCGWIGFVVLAKIWGDFAPVALGTIGFALSFISLFGIITDLGFSSAHVKRVSEGQNLGKCIGTFATIKIILTTIMVITVIATMFIWKTFFKGGFEDATTESVVYVMIAVFVFRNLQAIPLRTFSARREIAKLQISTLFENFVHIPLTIIVAIAGATGVMLNGEMINIPPAVNWPEIFQPIQRFIQTHILGSFAMTYVFGAMAVFLVGLWFMRKYPIKKPDWNLAKYYFKFAFPVILSSIIATIATNVDKIMIGYYWTETEVGYYFAFERIIGIILVLHSAVGTVLFPTISEQNAKNNTKGILSTVKQAERYISMIIIPPIGFILIFLRPVIGVILNEAFLPAASVLMVLLAMQFIRGLTSPYSNLINGINRPDILAKIGVATCIVNIILNFLFIPKNGLLSSFGISGPTGAATATVISFIVPFIGLRLMAKKLVKIKLFQTHTIRHVIAGALTCAVLYFIAYKTTILPGIHWYTLILLAAISLGIYIAILFLLREFTKKDLKFFLNIINPRGMAKYVKDEIKTKKK